MAETKINSFELLKKMRENKPLVHHITNWVTIYDCANITRAFGALPVMAHAKEESADMANIASALVLNIGTLTPDLIDSMISAGKSANKKGIPIILDAVGAGATKLRTDECHKLLTELKIEIIKGNAGEIATLAGAEAEVKGVESMGHEGDIAEIAKEFAKQKNATIAITGAKDIVVSPEGKVFEISNGHEMMGHVVGTGCMAASVIGSFAGVAKDKDYAVSTAAALSSYGVAGELAAKSSKGPGTFKEGFYDAVYNLTEDQLTNMQKIEQQ
ncbi:hydroxyethylthiazole kinase [Nanoarchaeota archaeon]